MPETDSTDFTDREKYILIYYRSKTPGQGRHLRYDLMFAFASIGCVIFAVIREDTAFWFVGYMLLLGRLYYLITEGGRYSKDFQNIFAKYDAKLKALTEAQKKTEIGNDVD